MNEMGTALGIVLKYLMETKADEKTMEAFDYIRGTISAAIMNAYLQKAAETEIQ